MYGFLPDFPPLAIGFFCCLRRLSYDVLAFSSATVLSRPSYPQGGASIAGRQTGGHEEDIEDPEEAFPGIKNLPFSCIMDFLYLMSCVFVKKSSNHPLILSMMSFGFFLKEVYTGFT